MLTENKRQRIPRAKWLRRVQGIQAELREWSQLLSQRGAAADSVELRHRLWGRAESLDDLWHELEFSRVKLEQLQRWPVGDDDLVQAWRRA